MNIDNLLPEVDDAVMRLYLSYGLGILFIVIIVNIITLSYVGNHKLDPADWRREFIVTLSWLGITFQIVMTILSILVLTRLPYFQSRGVSVFIPWFWLIGGWLFQITNIIIIAYLGPGVPRTRLIDSTDWRRKWIIGLSSIAIIVSVCLLVYFIMVIRYKPLSPEEQFRQQTDEYARRLLGNRSRNWQSIDKAGRRLLRGERLSF